MSTRRLSLILAAVMAVFGAHESVAQIVRVSVASDGTPANGDSGTPAIADGGRFVAFMSVATNLVANDTNGFADIFLRDRDTDGDSVFDEPGAVSTVRVSERMGVQANGPSQGPVITPDGRYVFFASRASSLFSVGQPQLPFFEVFRWDRLTGAMVLVSQTEGGEPLNETSHSPAPTADGNRVYFVSYASNGPLSGIGSGGAIFGKDVATGALTIWSAPVSPAPGVLRGVEAPSTSADGGVLAYGIVDRDPMTGDRTASSTIVLQGPSGSLTLSGVAPHVSRDGAYLTGTSTSVPAPYPVFRRHLATGAERRVGTFGLGDRASASPSGRYVQVDSALYVDFDYGSFIGLFLSPDPVAFDGFDVSLAYTASDFVPMRQTRDVLVIPTAVAFDSDADGLHDNWETLFGLVTATPGGATGVNGPTGDPDSDGRTNAQEFAVGSNPVGNHRRFLAEGTSSPDFFSTRVAIVNPGNVDARIAVRYDAGSGVGRSRALIVPARTRATLDSHDDRMDGFSFSTVVDSDQPVVVDRLVSWGSSSAGIYGSHAETSAAAPGTTWFLAEGSTVLGFHLFYLLQNPGDTPTDATVRFLLPTGPPVVRTYVLPARSRSTISVNGIPGLESTDVSAEITAPQPIAVERAMYRDSGGRIFELGHDAAAVATPAATWLFAEGSSNAFFDTYLLIANPSGTTATVEVAYLRDEGGPVTRTYTVPAGSRFSVFVDAVPGLGAISYGMRVTSSVPVVAERAMYWAGGFFDYYEGHVSAGANAPAGRWVLAESEVGSSDPALRFQAVSFVLVANTGGAPASVRVRTLPEAGGAVRASGLIELPAGARVTIPMSTLLASGRFGVEVIEEGTTTGALIVEGAIYWSSNVQPFAAGANWPATRLP